MTFSVCLLYILTLQVYQEGVGGDGLPMVVLQGRVLWVHGERRRGEVCVVTIKAPLVNGFHQWTGRLNKGNSVIH